MVLIGILTFKQLEEDWQRLKRIDDREQSRKCGDEQRQYLSHDHRRMFTTANPELMIVPMLRWPVSLRYGLARGPNRLALRGLCDALAMRPNGTKRK